MNPVDDYIMQQKAEIKEILRATRQAIRHVLPDLEEKITYGMPTYKDHRNVIHFAAQKNHLGIYPGPNTIEAFSHKLRNYKTSKGAIQFPYDHEIPYELIADLALYSYKNQRNNKKS